MTDVVMSRSTTRGTDHTSGERHHRDAVSDRPVGHTLPERGDRARHLVAEHGGQRHTGVHGAVEDVQVGAADPGVGDLDRNLSFPWIARVEVVDLECALTDVAG